MGVDGNPAPAPTWQGELCAGVLGDGCRSNPIWKWAYLKFSILIREVVSNRLRTSNEWKKLRRGADSFGTVLNILVPLKEACQGRGTRVVSFGSELLPHHALLSVRVSHTASPAEHQHCLLEAVLDMRPKRKISSPEGVCSPEPSNRHPVEAPLQLGSTQVLLAFSLEDKAAKGAKDKR